MTFRVISQSNASQPKPVWAFKEGVQLGNQFKYAGSDDNARVTEFIGNSDFAQAFRERQEYEFWAGLEEVVEVWRPLYNVIEDPNLPEFVNVNVMGPAGVVMNQILEGGEVQYLTVGETSFTAQILHYAVGARYTKQMMVFNRTWDLAEIEREVGRATRALLNHIHLNPIISAAYAGDNQTAANTDGSTIQENYLLTLEDAITASKADSTNYRAGPYALLVASGNRWMWTKALNNVMQEGVDLQGTVASEIAALVEYDGWSGTMGGLTTTYTGVTAGTSYLISLPAARRHLRSYIKQNLMRNPGDPDNSRFIVGDDIWDIMFGVYTSALGCVEEITLPTSA